MAVAGCGGDDENEGKKTPPTLPAPKGENALSGKTYVDWGEKITFDATAEGATQGTYTKKSVVYIRNNGPDFDENDKYKYVDIETGSYSWDETANTVTLLPAKIAVRSESGYSTLKTTSEYRAAIQAMLDEYKTEMGDEAFYAQLQEMGFSTVAAYLDYAVADAFKSVTNNYAFSNDAKALFLDEPLPANKGSNELFGKKYYGTSWNEDDEEVKDETKTYEFKADGTCTYTETASYTQTYIYAYDSTAKMVYLKVPTEGRDAAYTQASTNISDADSFASADEYTAARVNGEFNSMEPYKYGTSGSDNILERR
jgi:hypothetical protein